MEARLLGEENDITVQIYLFIFQRKNSDALITSWPLLFVSLLTRLIFFLPNFRTEVALNTSCSVVLLIGIVPSGHDSPEKLHN